MRRFAPFVFLTLVLLMTSCVTAKTYTDEEKKMRLPTDQFFIIKTDGQKVVGSKVSTPGGFNFSATWVKLDGQKYEFDQLQNFQDRHSYYAKFNDVWAKQLKRGKINLFYYETQQRVAMAGPPSATPRYETIQHFVFQKGDEPLHELSIEAVSALLSDNREAQDKFDAQFQPGRKFLPKQMKNHPKVLFEVIDIYNNS
jgi:hypothetical protein